MTVSDGEVGSDDEVGNDGEVGAAMMLSFVVQTRVGAPCNVADRVIYNTTPDTGSAKKT